MTDLPELEELVKIPLSTAITILKAYESKMHYEPATKTFTVNQLNDTEIQILGSCLTPLGMQNAMLGRQAIKVSGIYGEKVSTELTKYGFTYPGMASSRGFTTTTAV